MAVSRVPSGVPEKISKYWAELKGRGGAKRTEKQNLARMGRNPFFDTLRKLFLREILGISKGVTKRNGIGGGERTEGRGVGNCFPCGVSS